MRGLFVTGLILVVLGIASLFVAIPRREKHGISVGGAEVGVEIKEQEKISPIVSAALIGGGALMMIAGRRKSA